MANQNVERDFTPNWRICQAYMAPGTLAPLDSLQITFHMRHAITTSFAIVVGALGIGALWSILSLLSGGLGAYLAIAAAIAMVLLLGAYQVKPGIVRASLAFLLTALAIAYQCLLFALGIVAGEMGYSLSEAWHTLDFEFASAIVRAHTGKIEIIAYSLALLLAVILGWRGNRASSYSDEQAGKRPSRAISK